MGNCMETCKEENKEIEMRGKEGEVVKDVVSNENGLRVKMVLTKEELQWLMMQLSNRENGVKRIEDVFGEIEKGRKKVVSSGHSWKPSLDSITEIPEVHEMNR
ncbi:uncharacterized protein LOC110719244 [Chenopodium quinoa]|uniref:uncharacterized protein LOC110719244 n=1 Tax=Chenopodium quinoa TaxID=63459 RepID=UPI000B781B7D|nr:uncharacterized protein LOC110719244 [Chenopodium quinoa]